MKKNKLNIIVTANFEGFRIDKFLDTKIKELSRTRIKFLIENGCIKLNNNVIKTPAKKVKRNNIIHVSFPKPKETSIKPNKIPLDILYEDNDLIIINKMPGVVIHPGAGNYEKTIVNALSLYQFKTAAKPMHNKKITCPIWDMINKNRLPSLSDNDPSIGTKIIAHNVFTVVANVIIYCAQPAT